MNILWLVPLAIGALGAVGLAVVARKLLRYTEQVEHSLRPLRTERVVDADRRRPGTGH